MYYIYYILHIVYYIPYTIYYMLYTISYIVYILYTIYDIQHNRYHILCAICYLLYTIYDVHTTFFILYRVCRCHADYVFLRLTRKADKNSSRKPSGKSPNYIAPASAVGNHASLRGGRCGGPAGSETRVRTDAVVLRRQGQELVRGLLTAENGHRKSRKRGKTQAARRRKKLWSKTEGKRAQRPNASELKDFAPTVRRGPGHPKKLWSKTE